MTGALPFNLMRFARLLRRAGLAIGPGKVVLALEALQLVDLSRRDDVYAALHAVFVERHADSQLFRFAFDRFWAQPLPHRDEPLQESSPGFAGSVRRPVPQRISEAFGGPAAREQTVASEEPVAVTWSAAERLRHQDFETMTAAEVAEARRLIAQLRLPLPEVSTRRYAPAHTGNRIDMRATLRHMVREGELVELRRRRAVRRHPPLVVLCDISGSMAPYARMLLHFLHAITTDRDRVHTFLFGTRLTNVTRELAHRDPDEALSRVTRVVRDWSGGTRIGRVLGLFNRLWSRRVLGQGAVVLLISDGLDRDAGEGLAREMERLHRSCRRLIWLNPLLRFDAFEPKSAGIRAMLPHVDDFRSVHNLDSLARLVAALSAPPAGTLRAA